MSSRKRYGGGEHAKYDPHARGPNGRPTCRRCCEEVPKGKRTFCSQKCVGEYLVRTSGSYLRSQVKKRDKGICALCGLDCNLLGRVVRRLLDHPFDGVTLNSWGLPYQLKEPVDGAVEAVEDLYRTLGMVGHDSNKSHWEADHILPVEEGGGQCGLDNLRTLCVKCHSGITGEHAGRRARRVSVPSDDEDLFV